MGQSLKSKPSSCFILKKKSLDAWMKSDQMERDSFCYKRHIFCL